MLKIIKAKNVPQPIGPYAQGVIFKNIIFLSGQLPINYKTGKIDKNISVQTKQSLKNIKKILKTIKLNISNIVKITIFLKNINDFSYVNESYKNFFIKYNNNQYFPARSCIEVSCLPHNAKIEIDAIAAIF